MLNTYRNLFNICLPQKDTTQLVKYVCNIYKKNKMYQTFIIEFKYIISLTNLSKQFFFHLELIIHKKSSINNSYNEHKKSSINNSYNEHKRRNGHEKKDARLFFFL